jgi:DNA repair exonuclease SbcCD ATPase subunit
MRRNLARTIESIVLVSLLMPVGMLLATETYQPPAVTSSTANWYDVEQASNLLNEMQTRALHVRKEVARLQVQEIELGWQAQAARLVRAKNDINTIGNDMVRLDQMRSKLEPWQQSLINKTTPALHEMVYQTDAAINRLNAHQSRTILSLTQYPKNINQIYRNATQMANTFQTVTQYAHAEEKMAELSKGNLTEAGS